MPLPRPCAVLECREPMPRRHSVQEQALEARGEGSEGAADSGPVDSGEAGEAG